MPKKLAESFAELVASDSGFPMAERGDTIWTRAQVLELAERIAADLPSHARAGLVALQCPNGPHFLAALVALWQNSCPPLLIDHSTPPDQAKRLAINFGCATLLAIDSGWASSSPSTENWHWHDGSETPRRIPNTAIVKLTSGSTGHPRGIAVSEAAVTADEAALYQTMALDQERILTTIPLSHSYGFSSIALAALRRDVSIVQPETDSPIATLKALRHANVTFFPSVPAWLAALVQLEGAKPQQLGTVRLVISAGAPLPATTARSFQQKFGLPIKTFYGASECGGIAFDRTGKAGLKGSLGEPVDGVQITIDTDTAGPGRVRVTSAAVANGYLEPGSADIRTSSDLDGTTFLSSDIGTLEAGGLTVVGRIDDVLNLKGKKVYPSEVERTIVELNGVTAAFVFAEPITDGQTSARLKALVATTGTVDRAAIVDHCRQQLAEHKRPRSITLVESLPLTDRGKLDRVAARALCRSES